MRSTLQARPRHRRPVRPGGGLPTILGLALLLSGCAREADTFSPHIMITEPEAGSVSRTTGTVVRGYVMDDHGVRIVRVNGRPVERRGGTAKIYPFAFRTSATNANADYNIEAEDSSGRRVTVELPIRYDDTAPTLTITKFEREGVTLRVTGVAEDNLKVASITVDGNRLGVSASRRVPFYAESSGEFVDVVVTDSAGNQKRQRVR